MISEAFILFKLLLIPEPETQEGGNLLSRPVIAHRYKYRYL